MFGYEAFAEDTDGNDVAVLAVLPTRNGQISIIRLDC